MKTHYLLKIIAPLMVALGIFLIMIFSSFITQRFGITSLFYRLSFMPKWVIQFVGIMNILTFLPFFVLGIITLGTDAALGRADKLRTWSVYRYIRNPMYAGISFTVFGFGLFSGVTGVAITGLLWLTICFFVSLIEERSLTKRYGKDYLEYKNATPRFIPDFQIMLKDIYYQLSELIK